MSTFFNSVLFRLRRTQCSHCNWLMIFVGAILTTGIPVPANDATTITIKRPVAAPPNVTSEMMVEYRQKFAKYKFARQEFDNECARYWKSISDKRRVRSAKRRNNEKILLGDYVLTQPPVYRGPPRPVDPSAGALEEPIAPPKYVPIIADFLKNAAEQFQFEPQNPVSEIEFKRTYAKVASAAGLTKEQVVRIYGFEAGGNGKYDVQAGLEYNGPNAHAVSTALGYNQLLATSSVELLAEQGSQFVQILKKKADSLTESQRIALKTKIAILQRMIDFSKTVPDDWSEHERLANTPKGLGIHALNLDIDLGPLLQVQKLLNSINFARQQGYSEPLSAAELEMMNLTGDGNGFDIITMPNSMRTQVPTSNFFQQGGYERNPVASKNNVVSELLAVTDSEMDGASALQGAKDLAAAF